MWIFETTSLEINEKTEPRLFRNLYRKQELEALNRGQAAGLLLKGHHLSCTNGQSPWKKGKATENGPPAPALYPVPGKKHILAMHAG